MFKKLLLSLLSALLLSLPWLGMGGMWSLVALVPLLILQQERTKGFIWWAMLSFTVWILLSAWWVSMSTIIAAFAVPLVGLFFCWIPFMVYHYVWRKQSGALAWVILVTAWIAFEALYTYQDISFPWLNLGNAFAESVWAIQWYELTGTFGGTLWILVSNILAFNLWQNRRSVARIVSFALWVLVPISWSVWRYTTYTELHAPVNVCVVQPNIDPYGEKFGENAMSQQAQNQILMQLAAESATDVDFIVTPETSLDDYFFIEQLSENPTINNIQNFIREHRPEATMILGATTFDINREIYNSAMWVDSSSMVDVYHKSKLVVGVELIPYPAVFELFRIDLGGVATNLGRSAHRDVHDSMGVAICYESIYGAYFTEYIDNGARVMSIITNDGWWGDTRGYHQHLSFARLRAIETRRSIARSANTGISAIINQRGDVVDSLGWDSRGVLNGTINANDSRTLYVETKDLVVRLSLYVLALSLLYFVGQRYRAKN